MIHIQPYYLAFWYVFFLGYLLSGIASQLSAYDDELLHKTGHNLRQIACQAAQLLEEETRQAITGIRIGLVPIQWGLGKIEGFCEANAAILNHLGFGTFISRRSDLVGLAEAYQSKADAIFLSDDNDFVVLNAESRQYVHNSDATGKGFAAGLDLMANGVADKTVLVMGCGTVGQSAISTLLGYGAMVTIYDIDSSKCRMYKKSIAGAASDRTTVATDIRAALSRHTLVVDATNAAEIISAEDISPRTFIAAPGIPLGLSRDVRDKIADRLLHDPLQIGVTTMGMEAVKQIAHRKKQHT